MKKEARLKWTKLAAMGFRAFLVMDNTVARLTMAEMDEMDEIGSHGFPRMSDTIPILLYRFICDSVDVVLLQPKLNLKISSLRSRVSVFDPIYSEEYGLLIKNVPRKKLNDILIQFVLDSHYSVLSKMITDEDRWFSKDYTYTSGIWSHRYVSLIYREQTFDEIVNALQEKYNKT